VIEYVSGDLFESGMQTLVNPVNTVGVMGAGLALQFARRYPEMERLYQARCNDGGFGAGKLWLCRLRPGRWILCFATKGHWRDSSRLEYIERGLGSFVRTYEAEGIASIAFPMLGCGLGGLSWNDVAPIMESYLALIDINVQIYMKGARTS